MARIPSRNTAPEKKIRSLLHRAGFRFRLHDRKLPGTPDIVLPRWNAVIEVHGCFWHAHDCHFFKRPAQNAGKWATKHAVNRARDQRTAKKLKDLGKRHLVVWQCAIEGKERLEPAELSSRIAEWIRGGSGGMEIRGRSKGPAESPGGADNASLGPDTQVVAKLLE
jgi:DNA mismatch endonuclease (patch repair protein)